MKILKKLLMFFVAAAVCGGINAFGATYMSNSSFGSAVKVNLEDSLRIYSSEFTYEGVFYYFDVPYEGEYTINGDFRCTKYEGKNYNDEFTLEIYTSGKNSVCSKKLVFSKPAAGRTGTLVLKDTLPKGRYYFWLDLYAWLGPTGVYDIKISTSFKCVHSNTKDTQTKAPTCSAVGELETRCTDCREVVSVTKLDKLAHTLPGEWEQITEPTCSSEGQRIKKCTVCGETAESETIDKLPHTFSDWAVSRDATCAKDGENKRTCSVCGFEETEPIPALKHTFGEWKVTKAESCADEGEREHTCTVCGKTVSEKIEKLDHKFGKWETLDAASCTKKGKRRRVCQNCGEEQTEVLEMTSHRYGAWKTVTETTCQRGGERKRTCSECNDTQTETVSQTGHDYSAWKVVREPTESYEGYNERYCKYCNKKDTKTISKLVHGEKTTWKTTTAATCTSEGKSTEYCDYCGSSVGTKTIKKLEHRFGEWTTAKEPTPTSEGLQKRVCSLCKTTEEKTIPKLSIPGRNGFKSSRTYGDKFSDVKSDDWFYNSVKTAYEYNLVNGMSEKNFSPKSNFTVAQVLTVAATLHSSYYGTQIPAAANGEKWYQRYVKYCIDNKIITSSQFSNYDANIKRGEMAQVFANVLPDSEYNGSESEDCPDVYSGMACYDAVRKLYKAGIVTGDANSRFYRPEDNLTRAEACVIFTRIAVSSMRVSSFNQKIIPIVTHYKN